MRLRSSLLLATAFLVLQGSPLQVKAEAAPSPCLAPVLEAEQRHGIPQGLLMAIARTESGRRMGGTMTVWPWTVNVEGEGHYFSSQAEAVAFVRGMQAQGRQSIDVGCMQINLHWHATAFNDLEEAFDPAANVAYAAVYLNSLRNSYGTVGEAGWIEAAGLYHNMTPEIAAHYREQVLARWQKNGSDWLVTTDADNSLSERDVIPATPWINAPDGRGLIVIRSTASGSRTTGSKIVRLGGLGAADDPRGVQPAGVRVVRGTAMPEVGSGKF